MRRASAILTAIALLTLSSRGAATHRLYDGVNLFIDNAGGAEFTFELSVRDINQYCRGPNELLVKVYAPDGRPVVREVIPDDGVLEGVGPAPGGGWDHEAWYYETCYSRGLKPLVNWSAASRPERLATVPARVFRYAIAAGQPGVYRAVIVGNPDLYITHRLEPDLAVGVSGSPEWLHGHGDQFRRSFVYVPKGVAVIHGLFLQLDRPRQRSFKLSDLQGVVLLQGDGADGLVRTSTALKPGQYDDQLLRLEVSAGPGDFLLNLTHEMAGRAPAKDEQLQVTLDNFQDLRPERGPLAITAVLAADEATARACRGGAIYHDGKVFWQMLQVRLYDWLKQLAPEDFELPKGLPKRDDFISVGSHQSPRPGRAGWGDRVMHDYREHKNPQALNYVIRDIFFGMHLIGPGDHVAIGPLRNLAYEMGCYSYFFPRPAWRVLQQTEAPAEAKGPIREYVTQACDRLAFARTVALTNGNSFASQMAALRYLCEASGDELNWALYRTVFQRFRSEGFGHGIGVGPSGGIQESFGYDMHYGSYVLRGWKAILADLGDADFQAVYDGVMNLYSYIWSPTGASPQNSRTKGDKVAGGTYDAWNPKFRWQGFGGPDLTESVAGANEWFAARRHGYYLLTYHGRLTPVWMGEGFHGQIGFGGGGISQLVIPSVKDGTVIEGHVNGSYGGGMHLSQWRNFHLHSIVGTTTDGLPLVSANSEHTNARLVDNTVSSSAEVRGSSVQVTRSYTYGPDYIDCGVSLLRSSSVKVFALWGGPPSLRGTVREAYEMIPYANLPKNKKTGNRGPRATVVTGLDAHGEAAGELTTEPAAVHGVMIDRHGCGVRIDFDRARRALLGQNDTVLIQLAEAPTPASEISLTYRLRPYSGEPLFGASEQQTDAAPLPRLAELSELAAVPAALADSPIQVIKSGEAEVVSFRFGITPTALALDAAVVDADPLPHATVWQGSCLEVFGARDQVSRIGQVFLQPGAGEKAAVGYRNEAGTQVPAATIKVASEVIAGGYRLLALVPLSLLQVDPAEGPFGLEFQITSVVSQEPLKVRRGNRFGSKFAYEDAANYGRFRVAPVGE